MYCWGPSVVGKNPRCPYGRDGGGEGSQVKKFEQVRVVDRPQINKFERIHVVGVPHVTCD